MPTLTTEAFRDALAKGLGRPMFALREPEGPIRYADALIAGCVENLQLDRQCEANRAGYLMRLVETARLEERALSAILDAQPRCGEGWDRDLMTDLLEEFVQRGEARAWDALLALAQSGDERAQDDLATSGERGLAWVEANVLPGLTEEDRWRIGMWLPDEAADDQTETQHRLRAMQEADEARLGTARKPMPKRRIAPREFLDGLGRENAPWERVRGFVEQATDEEFVEAAERLLETDDRRTRSALRRVFREKAFPLPLERLFALADDQAQGVVVANLLGRINDPAVRAFALERLRRIPPDWNATEMLRASLRAGDEATIRTVLPDLLREARGTRHGVVLDLVEMMFKRKGVDWQPFAEWVYEHSPCSFCRASAVRWMVERSTLPSLVREEGIYDAELDIRELCGTNPFLTAKRL